MRGNLPTRTVLGLLAVPAVVAAAEAGPRSIEGEHDIGALLQRAESAFDLAREDAVYLLDSAREDWTADGRRVQSRHRILYICGGYTIRNLVDLRVPYDAARQRFTLRALRTWRPSDERWIESGPTAQVETLPFAVDHAPDYADRREMMLLHDGVELPCVLETAYAIEDLEPYRAGAEGLWSFARDQPAVLSRFVLGVPAGAVPGCAASAEVPEPDRSRGVETGLETIAFEMGLVEPSLSPQTPGSIWEGPHVVWSTFEDWSSLGRELHGRFAAAQDLGDEARRHLAERLEPARAEAETVRLVAAFVADSTRHVDDGSGWWPAPRSAARTWETAYGNRIDRAVLAAAAYREAGLEAALVFRGASFGEVDVRVPNLSWTDGPGLWIQGEEVGGYFDAASAEFSPGPSPLFGRAVWRPDAGKTPSMRWSLGDAPSRFELRLELHHDVESERWKGSGVLAATGALSPFARMAGLADEARAHLESLVGAALDGAEVTRYSPAVFEPVKVTVGFELEAPVGERDALGRLRLEIADPGALSPLLAQAAVHLSEESRGSSVVLPAALQQRLELRLDTAGLEVVRLPATGTTANAAGSCIVTATQSEGEIVLTRDLTLTSRRCAPESWPALRLLLLADGFEGNRLVLLK
jgi:hypothetical protein